MAAVTVPDAAIRPASGGSLPGPTDAGSEPHACRHRARPDEAHRRLSDAHSDGSFRPSAKRRAPLQSVVENRRTS